MGGQARDLWWVLQLDDVDGHVREKQPRRRLMYFCTSSIVLALDRSVTGLQRHVSCRQVEGLKVRCLCSSCRAMN